MCSAASRLVWQVPTTGMTSAAVRPRRLALTSLSMASGSQFLCDLAWPTCFLKNVVKRLRVSALLSSQFLKSDLFFAALKLWVENALL